MTPRRIQPPTPRNKFRRKQKGEQGEPTMRRTPSPTTPPARLDFTPQPLAPPRIIVTEVEENREERNNQNPSREERRGIEENTVESSRETQQRRRRTRNNENTTETLNENQNNELDNVEEELFNVIEKVKNTPLEDRTDLVKIIPNRKLKKIVAKVNEVIEKEIPETLNITEINQVNYAAGLYIQSKVIPNYKPREKRRKKGKSKPKPPEWKVKLQKEIETARKERSQIVQFLKNKKVKGKLLYQIENIEKKYKLRREELHAKALELEGIIPALARKLRNKQRKEDDKIQNKQFHTDRGKFYKSLIQTNIEVEKPPDEKELNDYWRPMFEKEEKHNENNNWQEEVRELNKDKEEMDEIIITPEKIRNKLAQFANFKKAGPDKVPNFWLKQITSLHKQYSDCFNRLLQGEEESPPWLTEGETTLIPKNEETHKPNKYRPICCLSTTYKLSTGLIADDIYEHLISKEMLESQQKGCRRKCLGTKDQLLINKTILEDCRKRCRNLSMAWIDYMKAYDNVPHTWILQSLKLYKVNPKVITLIEKQMQTWRTTISLHHNKGSIVMPDVKIRKGIFQGDSLSPLLFCLAIDPLSKILNEHNSNKKGYNLSQERRKSEDKYINHLLFMDDLKLYASSEKELQELLQIVEDFSNDINMKFGTDKCATCIIKKGKKTSIQNIKLEKNEIQNLEDEATYKYLGIEESDNLLHKKIKKQVTEEYIRRLKIICKTELTPKNKITAINQLATAVLSYSFGIINWTQTELNALDVRTRKILSKYKIIYKIQCHPRIYLPRSMGGLGLTEINQLHRANVISVGQYITSSNRKESQLVKVHQEKRESEATSVVKLARHFSEGEIEEEIETNDKPATLIARKTRQKYTKKWSRRLEEEWKSNQRAGAFLEELNQNYIDKEASIEWLKQGRLKYDYEKLIVAAQDHGLMTRVFMKMANLTQDDKCRFCHEFPEGVSHIIAGCKVLMSDGLYTERHNKLCTYLHWTLCKYYNLPHEENIYDHQPPPIQGNEVVSIYYDKVMPTATHIENSAVKPDIVVWDKEKKKAQVIEVSVPNDLGLNVAERRKINKYYHLAEDLKRNWNLDSIEIIPVIVGALGLIKKNLTELCSKIPGEPKVSELQTSALIGTVKVIKRALTT